MIGWIFKRLSPRQPRHAPVTGPALAGMADRVEPALVLDAVESEAVDDTEAGGDLGSGIDGGVRLSYPEAARRFLEWLQREGKTGEQSRARLKGYYARHIEEEGLAWLPENMFFEEFARIADRNSRRINGRRTTTYNVPVTGRARILAARPLRRASA